jgi:hypothetical protein
MISISTVTRALILIAYLLVGSVGEICGVDDGASCPSAAAEPVVFDVFAKWIDDRSLEGQKFLEQLFGPPTPPNDKEKGDGDGKSFYDEMKDASAKQTDDEETIENKIWRDITESKIWKDISTLKDVVDGSISQITSKLMEEKESSSSSNVHVKAEEKVDEPIKAATDFLTTFFKTAFSASDDNKISEESKALAAEFIQQASELSQYLQSNKSNRGFLELQDIMMKALGQVKDAMMRNFGHVDWHRLQPFSIVYFLENMESVYTPSWKRRQHAFAPEVSMKEVKELHKALYLADLAYLDTVSEIKAGLEGDSSDWELIYAQLKNAPGEPALLLL